jgi:hypothetical protein
MFPCIWGFTTVPRGVNHVITVTAGGCQMSIVRLNSGTQSRVPGTTKPITVPNLFMIGSPEFIPKGFVLWEFCNGTDGTR